MARAYTIGAAALALEVPTKWLDNALSHFTVVGVRQERQGVARRLSIEALQRLAVAEILSHEIDVPLARALKISDQIVSGEGRFTSAGGLQITVDLTTLLASLLDRLERAVEIAPVPRRGRPPKTTTGRLE
jgi:hypothetical protein